MVFKHPLQALQEDLDKIIEKGSSDIEQLLQGVNKANKAKIKDLFNKIQTNVHDRTQISLQRQQRRETEDAVFISGDEIKSKEEAQDIVLDALKTKFDSKTIGHIVNVDKINTKNKKKDLYKIQLKPRSITEVTMKNREKEYKTSLTTALFGITRENQALLKKKGKQIEMTRQIPTYLHQIKKDIDHAAKLIRDETGYQTKVNFNAKENTINAKYRKTKNDDWNCMFEKQEALPEKVQDKLNDIDRNGYVIDEKTAIKEMLNLDA